MINPLSIGALCSDHMFIISHVLKAKRNARAQVITPYIIIISRRMNEFFIVSYL